jgi:siroheme synthase-like protein
MKEKIYLPVMLDVTNTEILVLGGGKASAEKLRTLSQLNKKIKVISKEFISDFYEKDWLELVQREYQYGDLNGFKIVYCGINDPVIEKVVLQESIERNILINFIDKVEDSQFISVAGFIKKSFSIFISTYGKSPKGAKRIRQEIENKINLEELDTEITEYIKEREKRKNAHSI